MLLRLGTQLSSRTTVILEMKETNLIPERQLMEVF